MSAEVDLVAGLAIGLVGVDALRHVDRPAERLLAALPVVLASHQIIEAFVWWGLDGQVSGAVYRTALWFYLLIAFGVLPVLVPAAVAALEPTWRRWRVAFFAAVGAGVAVTSLISVMRGPVDAVIQGRHIEYSVDLWHGTALGVLYVIATCGSLLVSRYVHVRRFGAVNLAAAVLLSRLERDGLISLWCFWAAIASAAIAVHLRIAVRPMHESIIRTPAR